MEFANEEDAGAEQRGSSNRAVIPVSEKEREPEPEAQMEGGVALCLSGGGYRAMLFHLGLCGGFMIPACYV